MKGTGQHCRNDNDNCNTGFQALQDNVDVVNLADNDVSNNAEIGH